LNTGPAHRDLTYIEIPGSAKELQSPAAGLPEYPKSVRKKEDEPRWFSSSSLSSDSVMENTNPICLHWIIVNQIFAIRGLKELCPNEEKPAPGGKKNDS
jgi:hypothetical protein